LASGWTGEGSIPDRDKRSFSSAKSPDRHLFSGYWSTINTRFKEDLRADGMTMLNKIFVK
jgi:hypothetical protein